MTLKINSVQHCGSQCAAIVLLLLCLAMFCVVRRTPHCLVLRILEQKQFSSAATEWGVKHEPVAIQQYIDYQRARGNNHLVVSPCGFFVSESHPYLGASPDGAIYNPSDVQQPFGFLEVKCPYTQRNDTPVDVCSSKGFFCVLESKSDGTQQLRL